MSGSVQDTTQVLAALFGDGAWEISKALTEEQKRTQARVGLATNIVGLAAGAAGTKAAYDEFRSHKPKKAKAPSARVPAHDAKLPGRPASGAKLKYRKVTGWASKHPRKVAGAALALQVTNVVGDAVANRVLARESSKKVQKSLPQEYKHKALKAGVDGTATALKKAPGAVETAKPVVLSGTTKVKLTAKKLAKEIEAGVVKKDVEFRITGEISKMNTDKKQVFGWASVIEVNGEPVIDLQGDVMTIETVEKAAYDYVHKSRKGGRQHERNGEEPLHVSDMIESFVLTPEKKERMGLPDGVPTGWWVGFQINDDDTWQAYKDGKLKEFSIHGSGTRKALEV